MITHDPTSYEPGAQAEHLVDVVGVGFGPANLALAIAHEEAGSTLTSVYLDAELDPVWHPGMLIRGADIQHNPHRDLVSLRNPRSRYSFMNYLHETGRLIKHLNLPARFPLRREYADYIRWARLQVGADVRYGRRVTSIALERGASGRRHRVTTDRGESFLARAVVLGPGRTPYLPEAFAQVRDPRIAHLQQYLPSLDHFGETGPARVIVVGGSQSAVEIALDLVDRFPRTVVHIASRNWSLRTKDHSPFSEEIYFPEFVDNYHKASFAHRRRLDGFTRPTNYSSSDQDVLDRLYMTIHEQQLEDAQRVFVHGDVEITTVSVGGSAVTLTLEQNTTRAPSHVEGDLVVLATGFKDMGKGANQEPHHPLLDDVAGHYAWTDEGYLDVREDYSLTPRTPLVPPVYLNGLCESTHGIGDAGSFSLLSLRTERIRTSLDSALAAAHG